MKFKSSKTLGFPLTRKGGFLSGTKDKRLTARCVRREARQNAKQVVYAGYVDYLETVDEVDKETNKFLFIEDLHSEEASHEYQYDTEESWYTEEDWIEAEEAYFESLRYKQECFDEDHLSS